MASSSGAVGRAVDDNPKFKGLNPAPAGKEWKVAKKGLYRHDKFVSKRLKQFLVSLYSNALAYCKKEISK